VRVDRRAGEDCSFFSFSHCVYGTLAEEDEPGLVVVLERKEDRLAAMVAFSSALGICFSADTGTNGFSTFGRMVE
jgi:hypothetical protein